MGEFVYLQTFQGKSFCAKMALSTWRVRPSQRASPHWRSILIRVPFYPLSALSKEELVWLKSLFGFFFKKRQKHQCVLIIKRFAKLTLLRAVLSLSGNFYLTSVWRDFFKDSKTWKQEYRCQYHYSCKIKMIRFQLWVLMQNYFSSN